MVLVYVLVSMVDIARHLGENHRSEDLRVLYSQIDVQIRAHAAEAIHALRDTEKHDDYRALLESHGLASGTSDFVLKITGYGNALQAFNDAEDGGDDGSAEVGEDADVSGHVADKEGESRAGNGDEGDAGGQASRRRRRWPLGKKGFARLLTKWANIILGSMGAIPGAGALKELKEALEAGLDEL